MFFSKKPRTEEFEAAAMPHMNDIYRTAARLLGSGTGADDHGVAAGQSREVCTFHHSVTSARRLCISWGECSVAPRPRRGNIANHLPASSKAEIPRR